MGPRLIEAKRERRRAERQMLRTVMTVHKPIFRSTNKLVESIVDGAMTACYSVKILACTTSYHVFTVTNSLLGKGKSSPFPSSVSSSEIPDYFYSSYCVDEMPKWIVYEIGVKIT